MLDPKDIAKLISEDPDINSESYENPGEGRIACPKCGSQEVRFKMGKGLECMKCKNVFENKIAETIGGSFPNDAEAAVTHLRNLAARVIGVEGGQLTDSPPTPEELVDALRGAADHIERAEEDAYWGERTKEI